MNIEFEQEQSMERIRKLKTLSFIPKPPKDMKIQAEEPAYKRRGLELKHIPHSSEKTAKGFDDCI